MTSNSTSHKSTPISVSSKNKILINQSVAILCGGNNIERSIHEQSKNTSAMVNFDKLIPRLLNGRGLNRLIYFREGQNISSKLAERLHGNYYGSVVPCHKSADIPLSIKATQLSSKVDTIIIMSGDSDYVDLVKHLRAEGVRVEIAAVRQTTARILVEVADYFHPITEQDWFFYNRPKGPVRKAAKKGPSKKAPAKTETKTEDKKTTSVPLKPPVKKGPLKLPVHKARKAVPKKTAPKKKEEKK